MHFLKVIAFTHSKFSLEEIGKLQPKAEDLKSTLTQIKLRCQFSELLFLNTCNRVELLFRTEHELSSATIITCVSLLNPSLSVTNTRILADSAEVYEGEMAVAHVLRVASSLDSMVVGEREIITQVRKAYDFCNELELTGDFLRLLIRQTIETAKEIYTTTEIAKNPVSIASLAYRQLRELGIKNESRILFVGSGETNISLAGYFQKHQFANFTVFNRTLINGEKLAKQLNGRAFGLNALYEFKEGFDVLVVCTSSKEPIITATVFSTLLNNESSKKIIIDLGIPANVEDVVAKNRQVKYIDIVSLKAQAEVNLQLRKAEIVKCEKIIKAKAKAFNLLRQERKIELAFGEVSKQVRAIKELALNEVFAKEVNTLDLSSKEVLDKVLCYVEKKYNAVVIKKAKEVFLSTKY